jgi:bacteriocin-like protein
MSDKHKLDDKELAGISGGGGNVGLDQRPGMSGHDPGNDSPGFPSPGDPPGNPGGGGDMPESEGGSDGATQSVEG